MFGGVGDGVGAGRKTQKQMKEERCKGKMARPRKPKGWQPPTEIRPSAVVGMTTRARRTLEFQLQEKVDADAKIWETLQSYEAEVSKQTEDSIRTMNLEFDEHVFEEPDWTATTPLGVRRFEGRAVHGSVREVAREEIPGPGNWNVQHAGWAVLIPNRFLSEYSFHTGQTPSWTQGDVVAEYEDAVTARKMVICDVGGFREPLHFPACDVRMALGPGVRAQGSKGGMGYGWSKRKKNLGAGAIFARHQGQGSGGGNGSGVQGGTEGAGENGTVPGRFGSRPIREYSEPSYVEGADGTQDSTAQTVFPQVSTTLPEYMEQDVGGVMGDDGAAALPCEAEISSGEEWIPEHEDVLSSSEGELDREEHCYDLVSPRSHCPLDIDGLCHSLHSFRPPHLDMGQLHAFYRVESWHADTVSLLGSRDNFCGPTPGYRYASNS